MPNRKQRRAQAKASPSWMPKSQSEILHKLIKNGITQQDLEANYKKGFDDGFKASGEPMVKTCYAAACLAAKSEFGFGKQRILRLIQAIDKRVLDSMSSYEIVEQVLADCGIRLDFNDPFDRVSGVEDENDHN